MTAFPPPTYPTLGDEQPYHEVTWKLEVQATSPQALTTSSRDTAQATAGRPFLRSAGKTVRAAPSTCWSTPRTAARPPGDTRTRLHALVTNLVEAAFPAPPTRPVALITTDRTGRVDGAFTDGEDGEPVPVNWSAWLDTMPEQSRDLTLRSLGGLMRLYASHPDRNPLITVKTYEEWPAMVEVRLYE